MNEMSPPADDKFTWPAKDFSRVPYEVFTSDEVFAREQDRIFRGPTWNYVGLEVEIPNPGDFLTTFVGTMPVVLSRDEDGKVYCFLNKCAHRGSIVTRELRGNAKSHTCVYHQWCYDTKGELIGAPFRRGIAGKGGYSKDFKLEDHGLRQLRVDIYQGAVFVTFDQTLAPIGDYLGAHLRARFDRLMGRPLVLHGYQRQSIKGNWKLYIENVKDPYHGALLHMFNMTFGLFRTTNKGSCVMEHNGLHSILTGYRDTGSENEDALEGVEAFRPNYELEDRSVVERIPEHDDGLSVTVLLAFPNTVLGQTANQLAMRQVLPKSADQFDILFTYFGYADDDSQMTYNRHMHANLIGPAGLLSMEDGEAIELVQRGIAGREGGHSVLEMGGVNEIGDQDHMVTEVPIRGFWRGYYEIMGFDE